MKENSFEDIIIGVTIFAFLVFEFGLKKFVNIFYVYLGFAIVNLFFVGKIIGNIGKLRKLLKWEKES